MKRIVAFALTTAVIITSICVRNSRAQQAQLSTRPNPQIEKIVSEISPANIEATIRKLVSFGTRHTLSDAESPTRGVGAARRWIREEFDRYSKDSGGRLVITEDEFMQPPVNRVPKETKLVNVVATLPGVKPESKDRLLVVSGHYDSICSPGSDIACDAPGANDDASGTAAVMEMARVMSKYQFDATIVFMTVPGEEQGLLGATHWAEEAKKKNLNVSAMFTNDIIGNTLGGNGVRDSRRVRLFSEGVPSTETEAETRSRQSVGGENDSTSRQLARYIKEVGERYLSGFEVTLVFRRDRYGRGGDHIPFLQRGYAAVRFTEPNEDFTRQHQKIREENGVKYGDVIEMVDFAYIARVARVNAASLASLALAPAPPAGVKFKSARQEYDTLVSWDKNTESDVAGYRIVWRQTFQPFWERSVDVGDVTEFTLKGLSKDDYFFGVQAIDRDGNASVAVFPGQLLDSEAGRSSQWRIRIMKKTLMLMFMGTVMLSGTQTLNAQTTKTQRPTKNQPQYPSIIDLENKGTPPKTGTAEQTPDAGSTNVQVALVRAVESLTSEVRTLVHEMRALNVRQQAQLDLLRLTRGDLRIDSFDRELRSTIDRLAQIERDEQTLRAALTPEGLAAQVSRVGSIDKDETTRVIRRDLEARLAPLVAEKERLKVRKTELEGVVLGFRDANEKAERRLELVDDALRQLAAPAAADERKATGRKPDLD